MESMMVIMTGNHDSLMSEQFLLKLLHENVPEFVCNSVTDCGGIIKTNIGYIVFDQIFDGKYKVAMIKNILSLLRKKMVNSTLVIVNTSGSDNVEKYEILKRYIK